MDKIPTPCWCGHPQKEHLDAFDEPDGCGHDGCGCLWYNPGNSVTSGRILIDETNPDNVRASGFLNVNDPDRAYRPEGS